MSTKISYVPYDPKHAELMTFLADGPEFSVGERLKALSDDPANYAFTVMRGDQPVCALVAVQIWPTVFEVSAAISEDCRKYFATIYRSTVEVLDRIAEGTKAHRIQMTVSSDFKKGRRWAEALGFELETVLKHYGPEAQDFLLYRRLY